MAALLQKKHLRQLRMRATLPKSAQSRCPATLGRRVKHVSWSPNPVLRRPPGMRNMDMKLLDTMLFERPPVNPLLRVIYL